MHFKRQQKEQVKLDTIHQSGSNVNQNNVNAPLFPSNIRALMVGESACGKTNAIVSLLLSEHGLAFEHVHLVSPTACQQKYELLKEVLKGTGVSFTVHCNVDDINLEQLNPYTTVIFDDLSVKDYPKVAPFFYRGRHALINCLFLTHTYGVQPPQIVKQNANAIFFYKLPLNTLQLIHRDFVGSDMEFQAFLKLCRMCFQSKHDFMSILKDFPLQNGRYRRNFDQFVII
jgi:hypothetical protein